MNWFGAVWVVIYPLLVLWLPGAAWVAARGQATPLLTVAQAMLVSLSGNIALATLAAWLSIPLPAMAALTGSASLLVLGWYRHRWLRLPTVWYVIAIAVAYLCLFGAYSASALLKHDGLPTGDMQKAMFWAEQILKTGHLPDYTTAFSLNRDPADFYTPGLHALTALVEAASPAPEVSLTLFAVAIATTGVLVAAAWAVELWPPRPGRFLLALLTVVGVLANLRYLRYLNDPGYHFQNAVGEVLLFGSLLMATVMLKRPTTREGLLMLLLIVALALSHQFSTFLLPFVAAPFVVAGLVRLRRATDAARRLTLGLMALVALTAGSAAWIFGLTQKIPHLFTTTPHLSSFIPRLSEYPERFGSTPLLFLGLGGLTLMIVSKDTARRALASTATILLVLTQGPRLGVDIPPVRTLFYFIIPAAVGAALLLTMLWRSRVPQYRGLALGAAAVILISAVASHRLAFDAAALEARANATLTPPWREALVELRAAAPGAILIDDYNRRRASWLLLSHHPVVARLAAEGTRQMAEATQSEARRTLYLQQLAYEKIYDLGTLPQAVQLMDKLGIAYIVGVAGSSQAALSKNSELTPYLVADDAIIFRRTNSRNLCPPRLSPTTERWLFNESTVVNDLGDPEDTFSHLLLSLKATRASLAAPGGCSRLLTNAPQFLLTVNVRDFLLPLWDQDRNGQPDRTLAVLTAYEASPSPLTVTTPTGLTRPLPSGERVLLPADSVPFDDRGFLTLTITNPSDALVRLDVVAVGLFDTP